MPMQSNEWALSAFSERQKFHIETIFKELFHSVSPEVWKLIYPYEFISVILFHFDFSSSWIHSPWSPSLLRCICVIQCFIIAQIVQFILKMYDVDIHNENIYHRMGQTSQGTKRKEKYSKLNFKRNSFTFYVHIFCSSFIFLKSQKRSNIIHEFASWKISWHRIFIISFVRFFLSCMDCRV